MTTNGTSTPATFEGRVEDRNERGIKVAGDWWNLSKFKPLDLPARGELVRVGVDFKGFLTAVTVLEGAPAATANLSQRSSTRLEVLKAAATFAASREEAKSTDVLLIADRWLAWVERTDD